MARKDQVLVIAIRYDAEEVDEDGNVIQPPAEWDWAALVECDPADIKVIMAGPPSEPGGAFV